MRSLTIQQQQIYCGELILVNSAYPYRIENQEHWMVPVRKDFPKILLHKRASKKLKELIHKLNCAKEIVPVSGLRSVQEQIEIYEDCLREEGVGYTTNFVAMPGHSEHHTGLAIDLAENKPDIDFICPEFSYTGICKEFRENAAKYGFIERYKEGKEFITNVAKEPWHFRYVGYPHAQIIEDMDYTLEEYIEYLKKFKEKGEHLYYKSNNVEYEIFFVPIYDEHNFKLLLKENTRCQISGNNVDGIIVTLW
ncbi:D-alanyl-D-alanine carboxypeptidase [Clostridium tepidiprofundi DSM 19306]|uniref:D-alanyl-D-alanine carboxypeptidase n=1 Tax=Clostridium tepidiprofundi DSM 19306 TaxID=1121338 RepID=A0A151AS76_9CLOT|nr:D-alanyl-D-alanine carboxypeptidase family protein [Clostridium tepidiprofundi]KYH30442.1 D-alanyl-D-alanine carboxypeptidase [Clostridium tepidiprofundi DSM 19306]